MQRKGKSYFYRMFGESENMPERNTAVVPPWSYNDAIDLDCFCSGMVNFFVTGKTGL